MLFWVIATGLTLAVAATLASAFRAHGRASAALDPAASDLAVYRDQLKEVDRDLARGTLSEAEAEAVRVEISRRILEADRQRDGVAETRRAPTPAMGVALVGGIVVFGSLAIYAWIGAPGYGDMPIEARIAASDAARASRPDQITAESEAAEFLPPLEEVEPRFQALMDRLRTAVEERPDDLEGLTLLARNEARLGNLSAARAAQERIVAVRGDEATLSDRARLLDLMVLAAGGYVSPEAEALARGILAEAPGRGAPLYYIGLLNVQSGRADLAFPIWRRLLETSDPDAPWVAIIRQQIGDVAAAAGVRYEPPEVRGPSAADVAAAEDMSPKEREEMVRGMVAGLADRLAAQGGPVDDWARLITALGVLGETARAREIATEAEAVFADDAAALERIESARARAGVGE